MLSQGCLDHTCCLLDKILYTGIYQLTSLYKNKVLSTMTICPSCGFLYANR